MPLQGQSLRGKNPYISTYYLEADRGHQLASIGFAMEPLYLRVFHSGVALQTLALVFGFNRVKGISLANGQPFSRFLPPSRTHAGHRSQTTETASHSYRQRRGWGVTALQLDEHLLSAFVCREVNS